MASYASMIVLEVGKPLSPSPDKLNNFTRKKMPHSGVFP
jgi:hypothetical protein